MTVEVFDKWTVIDIDSSNLLIDTRRYIDSELMTYKDITNGTEHLYKLDEEDLKAVEDDEVLYAELSLISKLMDTHKAFYFRMIIP